MKLLTGSQLSLRSIDSIMVIKVSAGGMQLTQPFSKGSIYVLTNDSCPGLVKIGMTGRDSVETRVDEINRQAGTALPTPWELAYSTKTAHFQEGEKRLHRYFDQYRVNSQREYFRVSVETAIAAIEEMLELPSSADPLVVNEDGLLPEDAVLDAEPDLVNGFNALAKKFPGMKIMPMWVLMLEWYGLPLFVKHRVLRILAACATAYVFTGIVFDTSLLTAPREATDFWRTFVAYFALFMYFFVPFIVSFPQSFMKHWREGKARKKAEEDAKAKAEKLAKERLAEAKQRASEIRSSRRPA